VGTLVSLNKRPLCIDSKLVEKIDRVSENDTSSVWKCSLNHSIPYDEKFESFLPEISHRLSVIERFFDEVKPLSQKIELVWLEGMGETIRLQGSKIFLSQNLLLNTDQLERALVRLWLREESGESTIDRTLLEGSLVDLVMYSLGHPAAFETMNRQWPSLLSSEYGLCQKSPGTDATLKSDHYLMCAGNRQAAYDSQSILVGSGRPMISDAMVNAYMNLGIGDRAQLLHALPEVLQALNPFQVSSMLSEDSSVNDPELLTKDIENLRLLLEASAPPVWKKFAGELTRQLGTHGFSSNEFVARLDYLIQLGPDVTLSDDSIEYFRRLGKVSALVGIVDDERLLMLPGVTPLQKKIFGLLKAHQLMYLSCEIPSTEKLVEFSKNADRLLYVRFCGQLSEINFKEYFNKGYMGFAQSNPKLAFVEIHLPSLMQAWNGHQGNPLPALAKQDWGNPFFVKVGWKSPTWDEPSKSFKTRSVIQAIEAYRPLTN